MDKAYIAVFSFTFLFLLHCILRGKKSNGGNKGVQLPPSPPAIPFIGHLHLVAEKPLHATLRRLADRYGPVFSLRLGARNAVVVSSAAGARECFTEHDVTFANRPQFPSQLLVSFGGTSLIISNYGPRWRILRRVAAVQLLSAHRVACMSGVIAAEIRAMTRRLCRAAAAGGGAARVQLKRRLFELSLSVLMETIANTKGTRPVADADTDMSMEAQEFKKVMDEIIPYIGAANMWDFLPVMRWFDVFGVRNKILSVVSRRDAFLRRLIDAERQRLDDGGGQGDKKSMIAVLLTLQKTEPEVYTDTMITALCAVTQRRTQSSSVSSSSRLAPCTPKEELNMPPPRPRSGTLIIRQHAPPPPAKKVKPEPTEQTELDVLRRVQEAMRDAVDPDDDAHDSHLHGRHPRVAGGGCPHVVSAGPRRDHRRFLLRPHVCCRRRRRAHRRQGRGGRRRHGGQGRGRGGLQRLLPLPPLD